MICFVQLDIFENQTKAGRPTVQNCTIQIFSFCKYIWAYNNKMAAYQELCRLLYF